MVHKKEQNEPNWNENNDKKDSHKAQENNFAFLVMVPGENVLDLLDIVDEFHDGVLEFDKYLLESFVLFVDVAFFFHFLSREKVTS